MNIVVINGTMVKGCTYNIKEIFLSELKHDNKITEYYLPKDLPEFCCGCKTCFLKMKIYVLMPSILCPFGTQY